MAVTPKLQSDFHFIGITVPVNAGAVGNQTPNALGAATAAPNGPVTLTVQPGIVLRTASVQVNTRADGGNERVEVRVQDTGGVAEANTFTDLFALGVGTFQMNDEQGRPEGKVIGP